jgi:hypothetical protein
VELVLERLASAEARAVRSIIADQERRSHVVNESSKAIASDANDQLQPVRPIVIDDMLRLMTPADYEAFQTASERPEVVAPLDAEEDTRIYAALEDEFYAREQSYRRQQVEHPNSVASHRVNPVLCRMDGILPDAFLVRNVLVAWTRAYGLDAESIEDEHVALLVDAVESYLMQVIRGAIVSQMPGCPRDAVITLDRMAVEGADPFGV